VGARRYIIDSVHEKLDFSSTVEAVEGLYRKHGSDGIYIENRANGAAVANVLETRIAGINRVNPVRSKDDRVWAAAAQFNGGDWYLPHPQIASWVDEFLFEASSFPRSKHDDWVDAWSQAAGQLTSAVDYSMFTNAVQVIPGRYIRPPCFREPWEW
jgi:predicted phage terminase large subunit-like protein